MILDILDDGTVLEVANFTFQPAVRVDHLRPLEDYDSTQDYDVVTTRELWQMLGAFTTLPMSTEQVAYLRDQPLLKEFFEAVRYSTGPACNGGAYFSGEYEMPYTKCI